MRAAGYRIERTLLRCLARSSDGGSSVLEHIRWFAEGGMPHEVITSCLWGNVEPNCQFGAIILGVAGLRVHHNPILLLALQDRY